MTGMGMRDDALPSLSIAAIAKMVTSIVNDKTPDLSMALPGRRDLVPTQIQVCDPPLPPPPSLPFFSVPLICYPS